MFGIPNKAAAAFLRQAGVYGADIATLAQALAGDGVISGVGVSAQGSPNMTVAVAAGLVRIGGYFCFITAQNVTIAAADATNPRIDLVVTDWNGNVSRVAGTAAFKPVAPDVPANSIQLAQVYVPASASAILATYIYDRRAAVPDYFDFADEFLSSNLSATAATITGNFGEFGWSVAASGTLAAPSNQAGSSNHPGIVRTATGGTSGNNTQISTGSTLDPSRIARLRFIVAVPTITSIAIKLGLGQSINDAAAGSLGTAGAFIEFVPATSAKWRYTTRQASASTTNADTGADVAAGSWYQFDIIRKQNGNIQFLKNGALAFEHSTNLPTTNCLIGTLTHTLTTAARNLDHDFIGLNFAPLGNRYT